MAYTDIDKINKAVNYLQTHTIEIGVLGIGGNVPGMFGGKKEETKVLTYAWCLEFGTSKMKPFAFFRQAIESHETEIGEYVEEVVNDILEGNTDGLEACKRVGEYIRGVVIQTIATAGSWARPLNSKYEKWKIVKYPNRAGQTLILEGFLIKSIRYKIIKKGDTKGVYTSPWAKL